MVPGLSESDLEAMQPVVQAGIEQSEQMMRHLMSGTQVRRYIV